MLIMRSCHANAVRVCVPTAGGSLSRRSARTATRSTGAVPFQASVIRPRGCCSLGLAPAAHGANRTGRVFTGDGTGGSGDFLMAALHRTGFANLTTSARMDDGLRLTDAYIAAAVRCAPPDNKPLPEEITRCLDHLESEVTRAAECPGRRRAREDCLRRLAATVAKTWHHGDTAATIRPRCRRENCWSTPDFQAPNSQRSLAAIIRAGRTPTPAS